MYVVPSRVDSPHEPFAGKAELCRLLARPTSQRSREAGLRRELARLTGRSAGKVEGRRQRRTSTGLGARSLREELPRRPCDLATRAAEGGVWFTAEVSSICLAGGNGQTGRTR
jgi:hypothetical protein